MNTKYMNRINRMKNTRLGKIVCRLMGEEKGQAMMEYIIIAVVIAAACALIMAIWGKAIFGQADGAINATIGKPNEASRVIDDNRKVVNDGLIEAKGNQDKIHGDVNTKTVNPSAN